VHCSLQERFPEHLDAKLIIAFRDELAVECSENQAEEVACFVEKAMVASMDNVLNFDLYADRPYRVPVEVELKILQSWGAG
jgi:DNA polymerase I-like protein with 3'-5' exonuclease and polymerase domains